MPIWTAGIGTTLNKKLSLKEKLQKLNEMPLDELINEIDVKRFRL